MDDEKTRVAGVKTHTWSPECGGTLLLTGTHLIDDFRGVKVKWTHDDFVAKTSEKDGVSCKLIVFLYGEEVVAEILAEILRICKKNPDNL